MTDEQRHELQEREKADRRERDRARAIAEIMTSDPERQRVIALLILLGDGLTGSADFDYSVTAR